MRIIHIFKNTNEKFSEPYIDFVNKNFNEQDHFFYHLGNDIRKVKTSRRNIEFIERFESLNLIKDMYKAEKIIIHGLFSPLLLVILFFQPWLLKKSYWVAWGGDLYYYKHREKSMKSNFYELIRTFVIRNMRGIITHIKGDYELAKKWYGAKGKFLFSFMYPSNLYKEYNISEVKKDSDKKYIQIGNSANLSNNHLEIFKKLEKYKNDNIEIICPLSYGNIEYRNQVIKEGERIFGRKFNPLLEFLPFNQYLELLSKIDIAIFNHDRQQAMGNIITLLGLGKKVYIKNNITSWDFCLEHGLTVFSSNKSFDCLYKELDTEKRVRNINNVKEIFSERKLKEDLRKIFEE
ncbi:TDP-N-acetylfucosamine:lipid II N-acetylfucosaminyltransferase [Clostridium sp. D2Q-11]|uniref:TDP-N-acetylfucosamine:lipid II N-acetylfucosaminyltransferase n=1 Tax=Anaeromonas frigoriresistens TaxID=2683708 RepID=A0A942UYS3_9FIRM|nr:TDP-N-acetylfucosamine:lipid II N-acetylfucosaminyltransferase [Anaeromonas frigoriresistens]MBS4539284.1 TDP-N-acetylfucosamine:lipid II N-acetylfucosaminyltransferase [Anaeromonas frigoriresistens]